MKSKLSAMMRLTLGSSLALALTACTSAVDSTDSSSSSVEVSSMSNVVPTRAIQAGIDEGFFAEADLDVTVAEVPNPPVSLSALQGGSTDFAYLPLSTALTALSQGVDIQLVAPGDGLPASGDPDGFTDVDDTSVYIDPKSDISSPADLTGKTVAVPSRNGMMEIVIAGAVKADGGDPAEIDWIVLDQESQLTSLTEGRIDAAGLATPFNNKAEEKNMQLLVLPKAGFYENGVSGVWVTTSAIVDDNPELIQSFQQGITESNEWINTHIEEVTEDMAKEQDLPYDPEDVVFGYLATSLKLSDVERAAEKMADLGYLDEDLDLKNAVLETE